MDAKKRDPRNGFFQLTYKTQHLETLIQTNMPSVWKIRKIEGIIVISQP
jgi:hypothetical protein